MAKIGSITDKAKEQAKKRKPGTTIESLLGGKKQGSGLLSGKKQSGGILSGNKSQGSGLLSGGMQQPNDAYQAAIAKLMGGINNGISTGLNQIPKPNIQTPQPMGYTQPQGINQPGGMPNYAEMLANRSLGGGQVQGIQLPGTQNLQGIVPAAQTGGSADYVRRVLGMSSNINQPQQPANRMQTVQAQGITAPSMKTISNDYAGNVAGNGKKQEEVKPVAPVAGAPAGNTAPMYDGPRPEELLKQQNAADNSSAMQDYINRYRGNVEGKKQKGKKWSPINISAQDEFRKKEAKGLGLPTELLPFARDEMGKNYRAVNKWTKNDPNWNNEDFNDHFHEGINLGAYDGDDVNAVELKSDEWINKRVAALDNKVGGGFKEDDIKRWKEGEKDFSDFRNRLANFYSSGFGNPSSNSINNITKRRPDDYYDGTVMQWNGRNVDISEYYDYNLYNMFHVIKVEDLENEYNYWTRKVNEEPENELYKIKAEEAERELNHVRDEASELWEDLYLSPEWQSWKINTYYKGIWEKEQEQIERRVSDYEENKNVIAEREKLEKEKARRRNVLTYEQAAEGRIAENNRRTEELYRSIGIEGEAGGDILDEIYPVSDSNDPDMDIHRMMTKKQKNTYYSLRADGNEEAAENYLESLRPELEYLRNFKIEKRGQEQANSSNPLEYIAHDIDTVLSKPIASGKTNLAILATIFGLDDQAYNPNSDYFVGTRSVNAFRSQKSKNWGYAFQRFGEKFGWDLEKLGVFASNVADSIKDNLYATKLAKSFANSAGIVVDPNAPISEQMQYKVSEQVAYRGSVVTLQTIMSGEASADIFLNQLETGKSPAQSVAMALGGGVVEAITEYYSIDRRLKPGRFASFKNFNDFKQYVKRSMIAEGTEEVAADLLNTGLDQICSVIWNNKSEIEKKYDERYEYYIEKENKSPEEANRLAIYDSIKDYGLQLVESFAAGAVSAIPLDLQAAVQSRLQSVRTGSAVMQNQNHEESLRTMINLAHEKAQGTDVERLANKISNDLENGKKPKRGDVGKFTRLMVEHGNQEESRIYTETYAERIAQELQDKGMENNQAKEISPIVAKAVIDGTDALTRSERNQLIDNTAASQLAIDIIQETAEAKTIAKEAKEKAEEKSQGMSQIRTAARNALTGTNITPEKTDLQRAEATEDEIEQAVNHGAQRTGSVTEALVNGEFKDIIGFKTKLVDLKENEETVIDKKTGKPIQVPKQFVQFNENEDDDVELEKIRTTNPEMAKIVATQRSLPGLIGDAYMTDVMNQVRRLGADVNENFVKEAFDIKLAAVIGTAMPHVTMDATAAQELNTLARLEQKEADKAAEKNSKNIVKNIVRGQGVMYLDGKVYDQKNLDKTLKNMGIDLIRRQSIEVAAAFIKESGFKVNLVQREQGAEFGSIDTNSGVITIDIGQKFKEGKGVVRDVMATLPHELIHLLRAESAQAFNELKSFVLKGMQEKGIDIKETLLKQYMNYAQQGAVQNMDISMEDIIARACEQMFTSQEFKDSMQKQLSTGTFAKIKNFVKDILSKLNNVIANIRGTSDALSWRLADMRDNIAKIWLTQQERITSQAAQEAETEAIRPADQYTAEQTEAARDIVREAMEHPVTHFSINTNNPGVQVQQRKDGLMAVHNLSERSFVSVLEMLGFPMPSIAVIGNQAWTGYGDISVFFGENAVRFAEGSVYNGDAMTPTLGNNRVRNTNEAMDVLHQQPARGSRGTSNMVQLFTDYKEAANIDEARRKAYQTTEERQQIKEQADALQSEIFDAAKRISTEKYGSDLNNRQLTQSIGMGVLTAAEIMQREQDLTHEDRMQILQDNMDLMLEHAQGVELTAEDFTTEQYEQMLEFIDVASQLSSGWRMMESKPDTVLDFKNDLKAVLMPDDTPNKIIQQAIDAGIAKEKILFYPHNNMKARQAAMMELPNVMEGVRFSKRMADNDSSLITNAAKEVGLKVTDSGEIQNRSGTPIANILPGGTLVKHSLRSWEEEDIIKLKKTAIKAGFSEKKVNKWIKDIDSIGSIIAQDKGRLDFIPDRDQKFKKANGDVYKWTLDASTLCAKRLLYQGTFNEIQKHLSDIPLLPEDLIDLANMMHEMGYQTPCGICYVESRRRHLGEFTKEFLDNYQGEYKPTYADLTSTEGLANLKKTHRKAYDDYMKAMNGKGVSSPKVVQLRTDYRGDVRDLNAQSIKALNEIGGLRINSFSDFETPHLMDMMQAVLDMSIAGLKSQAYTKVPNFAWAFGNTGIKINLSLMGDGTGVDENGNLIFSDTEGMKFDEAMKLRETYSKNVGTILVGMNDNHIIAAMGDPRIDYIIPFHKSGWSANELAKMKTLESYDDYTDSQNEKWITGVKKGGGYQTASIDKKIGNLDPYGENGYWNYNKDGEYNARKYLELCAKQKRLPKFSQFLVDHGDGTFTLPEGTDQRSENIRKGYWKTLIDFKMYDNNGKGAKQQKVQFDVNMEQAYRILDEYEAPEGGNNALPVAQPVVDKYVNYIKEKKAAEVKGPATSAYGNMTLGNEISEEENGEDYDSMPKPKARYADEENVRRSMRQQGTTENDIETAISNAIQNPSKRFALNTPVEAVGELVAVHGMTLRNLLDTISEGSFTAPSIAVVKAKQGHNKFGEISVVFKKNAIDPKVSSKNKIYGADAWTPTRSNAQIETRLNYDTLKGIRDKISGIMSDGIASQWKDDAENWINRWLYEDSTTDSVEDMVSRALSNDGMLVAYEKAKGREIQEIKTKEKNHPELHEERAFIYNGFLEHLEKKGMLEEFMDDMNHMTGHEILEKYLDLFEESGSQASIYAKKYKENPESRLNRNIVYNNMKYARWYQEDGREIKTTEKFDKWETARAIRNKMTGNERAEFENWIKGLMEGALGERGVYNGKDIFTASGNRRTFQQTHDIPTAENIVKAMYRNHQEKGGEAGGATGLIAKASKEYKNLQEVRDDSGRLNNIPEEEYKKIIQGLDDRIINFAQELEKTSNVSMYEIRSELIEAGGDYARNQSAQVISNAFRKNLNISLTKDQLNEAKSIMDAAREVPTGYFEAKPQSTVDFDKVARVLVPDTVSENDVNKIESAGFVVETYDGTDEGRTEALNNIMDDDVRFSRRGPDMDINQWMMDLKPWQLRTASERQLLQNYKGLRTKIELQHERIEKTQRQIRELTIREDTPENKNMIERLKLKLQDQQKALDNLEEQWIEVTSDEGYAKMMKQWYDFAENMIQGKTQEQVAEAIYRMQDTAEAMQKRINETAEELRKLAKDEGVQRGRSIISNNSLNKAAADFRKQYHLDISKQELMDALSKIRLEIHAGEADAASEDVMALAGQIMEHMHGEPSQALKQLRGMTITLSPGQLKELTGSNRSLTELRRELARTGIKVKTATMEEIKSGKKTTLSNSWDELCDMLEGKLTRDVPAEQQVFELMRFIRGEMQAASQPQFDAKEADVINDVWDKALQLKMVTATDPAMQSKLDKMHEYIQQMSKTAAEGADIIDKINSMVGQVIKEGKRAAAYTDSMRQDIARTVEYFDKVARMAQDTARNDHLKEVIENLKSEAAQKLLRTNQEWRDLVERDRKARLQAEDNDVERNKMNTVVKRLAKLMSEPKNEKNIPEHMQGLARELMGILVGNDMSGGRRILQGPKKSLADLQRRLRAWNVRDGAFDINEMPIADDSEEKEMILNNLDTIREAIREWNGRYKGKNNLDTLVQMGKTLTKMQEAVSEIYSYIQAERYISEIDRKILVADAASMVQEGTKGKVHKELTGKLGGAINAMHSAIISGNMTPEYFFRMLDNEGISMLWDGYKEAENRNGLELKKAQDRLAEIAEKHGFKNWDMKQKHQLQLESGRTVTMTTGQLMSLYATWNREQTLGPEMSEHLSKGGFFAEEDTREGIVGKLVQQKRPSTVTPGDMANVGNMLSDEQRAFVNDIVSYMSKDLSKLGNEASMMAYGMKLYKETYYFPFKMWDGIKSRKSNDAGKAAGANQAFHPSFSKSRMHGANNAIIIGDFMQTATDHIVGMINYATMGLANENLNKVMNYTVMEENGSEQIKRNIRAIFEEAYGKEAGKYLEELKVQLNGGAVKANKDFYDNLISLFRKNAVAGSLSVALQQPLSYLRAGVVINPKYLAQALGHEWWKGSYEELMKYSGVAVIKDMGKFDMNAGQGARNYITPDGKESKAKKAWDFITDKLTILPNKMDAWTWTRMWVATKLEQKALHPDMDVKSDEFLKMAAKRFNDVMRRTQVYDSTLVRSANMRSDKQFVKGITSFMAEPTLTLNLLADGVRQIKQGKAGGKAALAKAGAAYLMSAVLQAVVKGFAGAGRNPDDDKTALENFLYRFGNSAISELDPLTMIPGYSDIITLMKDSELSDDAWGSIGKMFKAFKNTGGTIANLIAGNGFKEPYREFEDSVAQIVQLFSNLPAKNLMRDARMMYNWFIDQPFATRPNSAAIIKYQAIDSFMNADNMVGVVNKWLGDAGYKTTKAAYKDRIKEAEAAGNTEAAEAMREYTGLTASDSEKNENRYMQEEMKAGRMTSSEVKAKLRELHPDRNEDSIWWTVDRMEYENATGKEVGTNKYYRLWDAMDGNSASDIGNAIQTMQVHGVDAKSIKDQINSHYKELYMVADNRGKVEIRGAIEKAYKKLGYTADDADKVINKWK